MMGGGDRRQYERAGLIAAGGAALVGIGGALFGVADNVFQGWESVLFTVVAMICIALASLIIGQVLRIGLEPVAARMLEPTATKVSTASDQVEQVAQALKTFNEQLKVNATDVDRVVKDLRNTRDTLIAQDWYFPYSRFVDREEVITRDNRAVVVYVISDTLKFDTDDTLLPIVRQNLARGVEYRYILPKGNLGAEKKRIRGAVKAAKADCETCGGVKFHEVDPADPILFFNAAIFYFQALRAGGMYLDHQEGFVALDTEVKVNEVPWMLLRHPSIGRYCAYIDNIPHDAWSE